MICFLKKKSIIFLDIFFFLKMEKKYQNFDKGKENWTRQEEEILVQWCDKALCYRWLHEKSENKYKKFNYALTIPVIILSTLTGTANFGLNSFVPEEFIKRAQLIIGGVNIFAGILGTLQNFFRYAQNTEAHHNASLGWAKFHRNVSIELIIEPEKRQPPREFISYCRTEFDRLTEMSPSIPTDVIKEFNNVFKNSKNFDKISKPEVCDILEHTKTFDDFISHEEKRIQNLVQETSYSMKDRKNVLNPILQNKGNDIERFTKLGEKNIKDVLNTYTTKKDNLLDSIIDIQEQNQNKIVNFSNDMKNKENVLEEIMENKKNQIENFVDNVKNEAKNDLNMLKNMSSVKKRLIEMEKINSQDNQQINNKFPANFNNNTEKISENILKKTNQSISKAFSEPLSELIKNTSIIISDNVSNTIVDREKREKEQLKNIENQQNSIEKDIIIDTNLLMENSQEIKNDKIENIEILQNEINKKFQNL